MSVDRVSVTVPSKLGAAMRTLARSRGETVSTFVADAIAHRIRLAALDRALAAADNRFGPVPAEEVDRAETELLRATRGGPSKRRRSPR